MSEKESHKNKDLWKQEYWLIKSLNEPLVIFRIPTIAFLHIEDDTRYDKLVAEMLAAGVEVVSQEDWSKYMSESFPNVK